MAFPKVRTGGDLDRVQDAVGQALAGNVLAGALTLSDVALTSASFTRIATKLGRKWVGYLVIKNDTGAVIFDDGTNDGSYISLKASTGTPTVTLLVF